MPSNGIGAMVAVDLFAGLGGNSEGARMADVSVAWAANHWPAAVEIHAMNHPETQHACQDLQQADWSQVPAHDVLIASPCCQGHTRARGTDKPQHDASRSTAWAVVSCAEYHRSESFIVENVPEYHDWLLYPAWEDAMRRLGYTLSPYIIDAADHGVPQNRKRLFIVGTRSNRPILLNLPKHDHVPASSFIQWDKGEWTPIDQPGRSPKTLARVKNGRSRFGDRFLMPYYGNGSGLTGRSISRPIGTITTKDRWAIVDGDRMRMLNKHEAQAAMGFRPDYVLPDNHTLAMHMLGNAVVPGVTRDILLALKEAA